MELARKSRILRISTSKISDLQSSIRSILKNDGIAFDDKEKALISLSECVGPRIVTDVYLQMLAGFSSESSA